MTYAKTESDIQQKIGKVLDEFAKRGVKFNDISIAGVKINYEVEFEGRKRYADIAVLKDNGLPLLIIETKKKYERERGFRAERKYTVTSEEVLGQAFSYVAILKKRGIHVPFVATANDRQIAVFAVPEDIEKHVDWQAVRERDYGRVLSIDYIYNELRKKYLILNEPIRFDESFFANILEVLTGLYAKKYKLEDKRQEPSWLLIEDFRGFVDTLAPFILDAIAPGGRYSEQWAKRVKEYSATRGYSPSPEQLAREMAYVLLNKMVFYKVLERYYGGLSRLEPFYLKGEAKTVSEYLEKLKKLFEEAINVTGDFEPVFKTGIYDDIEIVESKEVLKLLDWLVNLIDRYMVEKLGDVIGHVYEELIPAEERHQLGQFYTPKPIAELIVKWCIRSPDDKVLDPGCGSGTFLIEAYKRLAELKLKKPFSEIRQVRGDVHKQILDQLYGVDINEFPAHLTAINLAMRNPRAPSNITNIIVRDYFTIIPDQSPVIPYTVKTARGEERVSMVFKDFDAVVGNPPYTRWTEIPGETQKRIQEAYGRTMSNYELTPQVARGVEPGIYVYWIIHSTGFLKDNGRLGMIISDSWLQTDYGISFGKFLLDNYKIRAVIDIATRVFPVPLIGTCIILAEKEPNEEKRMENKIVFMLLKPKESLKVDEVLKLVEEYSKKDEGYYTISDEITISVIKQETIYEKNVKWINFMFNAEHILNKLKKNQYITQLSTYFEVSRGNTAWSYWAIRHGERPDVGGNEFFYLTEERVRSLKIPSEYLYPLVPSSRYVKFFTFTKEDWERMRSEGVECYLFLCHKPRNELPREVLNYINMGENGTIRLSDGKPVNQSKAAMVRREYRQCFLDWYDLGGVVSTRVFATYYARYWHRFVYSTIDVALDADVMALIPRVTLTNLELKALLAYLNSSFKQLQVEVTGRTAGGVAALGLEAKALNNLLLLDIKKLPKDIVEKLAQLFDRLDAEARRLGGADEVENVFGSELAKELTEKKKIKANVKGLFNTIIKEIDYEVGRMLGFTEIEVEAVRGLVVELAKRRLGRAGEAKPTVIKGEEKLELVKPRGTGKNREEEKPSQGLDKWIRKQ